MWSSAEWVKTNLNKGRIDQNNQNGRRDAMSHKIFSVIYLTVFTFFKYIIYKIILFRKLCEHQFKINSRQLLQKCPTSEQGKSFREIMLCNKMD